MAPWRWRDRSPAKKSRSPIPPGSSPPKRRAAPLVSMTSSSSTILKPSLYRCRICARTSCMGSAAAMRSHAAKVVLGPGTGVGVAGLVWSGSAWIAVPGEGGHITLSAHTPREFELIERLRPGRDHLSADRVLSGPGVVNLYRAIAESHGRRAEPLQPNDVLIRGLAGSDPIAVEALAMLGRLGRRLRRRRGAALRCTRRRLSRRRHRAENHQGAFGRRISPGLRGEGPHAELPCADSRLGDPRRILHAARRCRGFAREARRWRLRPARPLTWNFGIGHTTLAVDRTPLARRREAYRIWGRHFRKFWRAARHGSFTACCVFRRLCCGRSTGIWGLRAAPAP